MSQVKNESRFDELYKKNVLWVEGGINKIMFRKDFITWPENEPLKERVCSWKGAPASCLIHQTSPSSAVWLVKNASPHHIFIHEEGALRKVPTNPWRNTMHIHHIRFPLSLNCLWGRELIRKKTEKKSSLWPMHIRLMHIHLGAFG